jgi:8-oxo-dGTP pyrophosphatase MutT (NUDIX family)
MRTVPVLNDDTPIRPSSTVVVARQAEGSPEIFMVRRHEDSSFGDAYAFPGGVIESDDARVHAWCDGLSEEEANTRLGVEQGGLDYYSAAVRELFEETGILLGDLASLDENATAIRDGLNDGSESWADVVRRNELRLYCDKLFYFSHWITPPVRPKRYSTRFFLTVLPDGQDALHCGGELTDSCWLTANAVLAAGRQGDVKLHFPTVKTLESIARHRSLESLVEWGRSCVEWGITSMVPMVIVRDGRQDIVLPGDKDYPGAKS